MDPHRGRPTPPAEGGFALIEVMVSALIAVMVTGAVIGLLNSTGRAGAEERHKSQAFSVAQEDQARLRATRITELNSATKPRTVTLNGTPYTVTSTATFVSDKTGTTNCSGTNVSADYVKLGSKVTWPSMRSATPIALESIVSPVSGSLDPNHGNLAITVNNAALQKVSGAGFTGTGTGSFAGSTDSNGCVLFGGLPAGNYTVTPALGAEYVDFNGKSPSATPISVTVSSGSTFPLVREYDKGGSVAVGFQVRNSSGVVVPSTADSIIAFNSGMTTAATFGTPGGTPVGSITASPLFPFTAADSFYAGSCTTNSPAAGAASVKVPSGGSTTATVQLPALYLTVKNSSGNTAEKAGLAGAKVTVTDTKCSVGSTAVKRTFTTNSTGNLPDPGLPSSIYELCASASISGTVRKTTGSATVNSLTGTSLTMTLSTGSTTGACP
jgi:Tfp pilus assembly protein PilV